MGIPGYSGYVPNSMLASSLVLSRDLLLAGGAHVGLTNVSVPVFPSPTRKMALMRLQPNLRMLLATMDLSDGITFDRAKPDTTPPTHFRSAATLRWNGKPLVTIHRPDLGVLKRQTELVLAYADLRSERINEVLAQVVPQVANWAATLGLHPESHKYTFELLGVGLSFATQSVMRFKHALGVPRPGEVSTLVHPLILTPAHRAFPSGHATEAYFAAEMLSRLFSVAGREVGPKQNAGWQSNPNLDLTNGTNASMIRPQLHRIAYRVAENRVVAGVHYPMDSLAGQLLGITLARHLVALCGHRNPAGENRAAVFGALTATAHSEAQPVLDKPWPDQGSYVGEDLVYQASNDSDLVELWNLAVEECKGTGEKA
jgi:membrane-associated phospholipid phosphatase